MRLWVLSSVILSAVGLLLLPLRDEILDNFLGLFLPGDWLTSIHLANEALFHKIGGVLLFQTVAIVCFTAVAVFFFPFRDRISVLTEECLTGQPPPQVGLHRELWFEAGLILVAVNVYSAVYLLAYFVGQPLFSYIDLLAFALLALFFTLDLLSPPHYRRNLNCLYVIKAFKRSPLSLALFGAVFCSPIFALELFLGDLVYNQEDNLVLGAALVTIIVINCFACIFALPLGTSLALSSIEHNNSTNQATSKRISHRTFFSSQVAIACLLLLFYFSLVGAVLSKVPLKTASYEIQWLTGRLSMGREGRASKSSFRYANCEPAPFTGAQG